MKFIEPAECKERVERAAHPALDDRKEFLRSGLVTALALMLAVALAGSAQGQEPTSPATEGDGPRMASLPSAEAIAERDALKIILDTPKPEDRLVQVEEFLARFPGSPLRSRALLAAAESYRMLGNFTKAIESAEAVLASEPDDVIAKILLADALVEGAVPSQAEYAGRATRAEGLALEAINGLAALYTEARRPPTVTPGDFDGERRFVESQPHATLGFIYLRREEFEQAEAQLRLSIELNVLSPNGADHLRLAYVHMQQSEWADAESVLDRAFEFGGSVAVAAHQYRQVLEERRSAMNQGSPEPPPE